MLTIVYQNGYDNKCLQKSGRILRIFSYFSEKQTVISNLLLIVEFFSYLQKNTSNSPNKIN